MQICEDARTRFNFHSKNPTQPYICKKGVKKVSHNGNGITTRIVCESSSHGSLWAFRKRAISSPSSYIRIDFIPSLDEHPPANLPDLCILCGSIVHHLFPIRDLSNLKFFNPAPTRKARRPLSFEVRDRSIGDDFAFRRGCLHFRLFNGSFNPRRCGASKTGSSLFA